MALHLWFNHEMGELKVLGCRAEGYALLEEWTSLEASMRLCMIQYAWNTIPSTVLQPKRGILFSHLHVSVPCVQPLIFCPYV